LPLHGEQFTFVSVFSGYIRKSQQPFVKDLAKHWKKFKMRQF